MYDAILTIDVILSRTENHNMEFLHLIKNIQMAIVLIKKVQMAIVSILAIDLNQFR